MRIKTIREELLFAAHDYHQKASNALVQSRAYVGMKGHKGTIRSLMRDYRVYARRAKAMDAALNLL